VSVQLTEHSSEMILTTSRCGVTEDGL
jgi:hypothetical protein